MPKEIERKFLVKRPAIVAGREGTRMVQGYVANEPMTVRVRIAGDAAYLTLKSKTTGIERDEYEFPIDLPAARELLDLHCRCGVVRKTRYLIPVDHVVFEVDVFDGPLAGLMVAEVELDHAEQAFPVPDWLGEEVTLDQRYSTRRR